MAETRAREDERPLWRRHLQAGTDDAPYYTNSSQLPVNAELDLVSAMSHQDKLQTIYTGGTVFHCFLGERRHDTESAKQM